MARARTRAALAVALAAAWLAPSDGQSLGSVYWTAVVGAPQPEAYAPLAVTNATGLAVFHGGGAGVATVYTQG